MSAKAMVLIVTACFLSVNAQTYYNLTVTAGPGGTTSPSGTVSAKGGTHLEGAEVGNIVAAYPDSGYVFDYWESVSGSPELNGPTISTTRVTLHYGAASVKAHFIRRDSVYDLYDINENSQQFEPVDTLFEKERLFRFTAPAAGLYAIVVEGEELSYSFITYYGTDPTLMVFRSENGNSGEPATCFVTALAAGEEHYFTSRVYELSTRIKKGYSVRYEQGAYLTIKISGGYEHRVLTDPIEHLPHNMVKGIADTVKARSYSTISPFSHWDVVSGDVTIVTPQMEKTAVIVNSDSAVIQAVFTCEKADTLVILNDGNGSIVPTDTCYMVPGEEALAFTAVPDDDYRFSGWTVIEGEAEFSYPNTDEGQRVARARVNGGKAIIRANFSTDRNPEIKAEVEITDIDISGHPDIYVSVSVTDSTGKGITGLDSTFFTLHEDGTVLPFQLSSGTEAGGMTVCMVINKGASMANDNINTAIMSAKTFISSMTPDDRCAVVAYDHTGHLVQEMTGDTAALNKAVEGLRISGLLSVPDSGINLAVSQLLSEKQPRIILMYSSASEHEAGGIWYPVDSVINNDVIIYRTIVYYYSYGKEILPDNIGGYYLDGVTPEKLAKLNQEVRNRFESSYVLTYRTPDTLFNGDIHEVVVSVNMNNYTARDTGYWNESNQPPVVTLTLATQALIDTLQSADSAMIITARVVDDGTIAAVTLFYRTAGSNQSYSKIDMTSQSGDLYRVELPASAINSPGVGFYIIATDEKGLVGKSPKILRPDIDPWVIFAGSCEEQPPVITLTSSTMALISTSQTENNALTITAVVNDDGAVADVILFYRRNGSTDAYTETAMTLQSRNIYQGVIPKDIVRSPGIDFYLMATDDKQLSTIMPNVSESDPWVISVMKEAVSTIFAVREAVCYADNGSGNISRVEMYYQDPLTINKLPDSLRVCWPDNSHCQTVPGNAVEWDPSDSTHLTVTLPVAFPEGITRYTGWNGDLGRAWHRDPASSDEQTMVSLFALEDGVGPLITDAVLVQRQSAGDDTLIVDFSENIDYKTLTGQSLTLLKDDGQGTLTEVPLTVSNAYPDNNGQSILAIVSFTDEAVAPKAGDSLRITADGPIIDESGNHAHLLNRPVVLSIKRKPPEILQAVYEDRDADGMVDTVRVIFSRTVSLDAMEMKFEWNGTTGNATMANFKRVGSGSGGDTIDVSIKAPLFSENTMKDRTSGNMLLTVRFTDYDESEGVKQTSVSDGAAPVLTVMRYHFGEYLDDNLSFADTLFVQFSEQLAETPSAREPFLFYSADGTNYHLYVRSPTTVLLDTSGNGNWENYYRFLVTEATSGQKPTSGNFGWINTAIANNIIDAGGTVQTNERNRKVPVYLKLPQLHLKLQAGPVPFNPIDGDRFTIRITGNDKVPGATEYRVRAFIYDMMGSVVKRFPEDFRNTTALTGYCNRVNGRVVKDGASWYLVTRDSTRIFWDGTNRQHRIVGKGTYLIIPQIFYTTSGKKTVEYPSERILVGVKR